MPALSMFYGIVVRMQSERGGKHNLPHVHAVYGDNEVVVGLDGTVLEGNFPQKQLKLVIAWIALHEEDLMANWKMLEAGEGFFRIDPLK